MQSGSEGNQTNDDRAEPTLAILSAHEFPSLYTWVIKKFICLMLSSQLSHLFPRDQGTISLFLKAKVTSLESVSSHKLVQFFSIAISIAVIAPKISALKAEFVFRFWARAPKTSCYDLWTQEALSGFLVRAPSVLTFIQFWIAGFHITSLIKGTLGFQEDKFSHVNRWGEIGLVTYQRNLGNHRINSIFQKKLFILESGLISDEPHILELMTDILLIDIMV